MVGDTAPKRFRIAVDALAVLTAVALFLSSWAFYTRFSDTNQSRLAIKNTWHAVICTIETQVVLHSKDAPAVKEQTLHFWDNVLTHNVGAAPCGLVDQSRR